MFFCCYGFIRFIWFVRFVRVCAWILSGLLI